MGHSQNIPEIPHPEPPPNLNGEIDSQVETITISSIGEKGGEIKVTVNVDGVTSTKIFKVDEDTPFEEVQKRINREMMLNGSESVSPFGEIARSRTLESATQKRQNIEVEKILTPWLGIAVVDTPDSVSKYLPLPPNAGVSVESVAENSPAKEASLKKNDIVFQIEEQIIFNVDQFVSLIRSYDESQSIKIHYLRKGEKLTSDASLVLKETPISQRHNAFNQFILGDSDIKLPSIMEIPGKPGEFFIYSRGNDGKNNSFKWEPVEDIKIHFDEEFDFNQLPTITNNPVTEDENQPRATDKLALAISQLDELRIKYKDQHPLVQEQLKMIEVLKRRQQQKVE
jgi:membrane-associated protease RseP (regulator of RpoE activity)